MRGVRLALVIVAFCFVSGACGSPKPATPVVSIDVASATPASSVERSVLVNSPSAPASMAASSAPIPNGDYVSGPVTKDMAEAILKDPAVAGDPSVVEFLDHFSGTSRSTMRLANGRWTQLVEQNGQSLGVGEEGTYAFADDHTIILQSTHLAGTTTFGILLQGDKLNWTVLKDSAGPADKAIARVIFESTTWTRNP